MYVLCMCVCMYVYMSVCMYVLACSRSCMGACMCVGRSEECLWLNDRDSGH